MTDQELKDLVAGLAKGQAETKALMAENAKAQAENAKAQAETRAQMAKTDARLDKVAKLFGNTTRNNSDIAEKFFANGFIKNTKLGNLKFDDVMQKSEKHRGKTQEEYDILLTNGNAIAIIEVKHKAHVNDLEPLDRKIKNFKKLFPIYEKYVVYGALASFHINKDAKKEILKRGYFAVERDGDLISTQSTELKTA